MTVNMECEKELCPLCNKPKIIGKEFVMKCLHTICEECHLKKDKACPICATKKRKFEDSFEDSPSE